MSEKREKFGRAFKLTERQATEPSLNTSPEKAGPERVKCADLSVTFTMKGAEIKKLDKGLAALWANGIPVIENLKRPIELGCTFKGTATIGSARGKGVEYENSRLTGFKVTPAIAGELTVDARIRVYLAHETDELYDLAIAGVCKIAFDGKLVIAAKSTDEGDDDEEAEENGQLEL